MDSKHGGSPIRQNVIAFLLSGSAFAMPLWAHAPYVEPYKHVSAFAVALVAGILTIVLLHRLRTLWLRVLAGTLAFLFCWLIGLVVCTMTSL